MIISNFSTPNIVEAVQTNGNALFQDDWTDLNNIKLLDGNATTYTDTISSIHLWKLNLIINDESYGSSLVEHDDIQFIESNANWSKIHEQYIIKSLNISKNLINDEFGICFSIQNGLYITDTIKLTGFNFNKVILESTQIKNIHIHLRGKWYAGVVYIDNFHLALEYIPNMSYIIKNEFTMKRLKYNG